MARIKYVALGDSFTEGVGDELPDGTVRGWADLLAVGLATSLGEPIDYANLAIRGRLLGPIIDEQLQSALDLGPTLVTINGGGNDILRPGADLPALLGRIEEAIEKVQESGAQLVLLSGGNPTAGLPMRERIQSKGDALDDGVRALAEAHGLVFADNWNDVELAGRQYWSHDRLHLGEVGHHRVAANVLAAIAPSIPEIPGVSVPEAWAITAPAPAGSPGFRENAAYYRRHVLPWIKRRLTGTSSGDGRVAKFPGWVEVAGA